MEKKQQELSKVEGLAQVSSENHPLLDLDLPNEDDWICYFRMCIPTNELGEWVNSANVKVIDLVRVFKSRLTVLPTRTFHGDFAYDKKQSKSNRNKRKSLVEMHGDMWGEFCKCFAYRRIIANTDTKNSSNQDTLPKINSLDHSSVVPIDGEKMLQDLAENSGFQEYLELDYVYNYKVSLIDGMRRKAKVRIDFGEGSYKTLIYDDEITVDHAISLLLDSVHFDRENKDNENHKGQRAVDHVNSYRLYLKPNVEEEEIPMAGYRSIASYKLTTEELWLKREDESSHHDRLSLQTVSNLQDLHLNSSSPLCGVTVFFPELQLYQHFHVDRDAKISQVVEVLVKTASNKYTNPMPLNSQQLANRSLYLPLTETNGIWVVDMNTSLSYYLSAKTTHILLEYRKKSQTFSAFVVDGIESCINMSFPEQKQQVKPKMLISNPMVFVGEIIAILKTMLFEAIPEAIQNSQGYGMYLPFNYRNQELQKDGLWLHPNQTLRNQQLAFHDIMEFKVDPKYSKVLSTAAETFSTSPTPSYLLNGELILMKKSVTYMMSAVGKSGGTLFMTNYRLIFMPRQKSTYDPLRFSEASSVPLSVIDFMTDYTTNSNGGIQVTCKDLRDVIIAFSSLEARNEFYKALKERITFTSTDQLFAFSNKEQFDVDGWQIYNPVLEYQRQGIESTHTNWRISYANSNYSLCPTYPKLFVIPASMMDDDLKPIAQFRSKGRIPVLSWIHPHNGASITRCSQPAVGITRSRCPQDEALVQAMLSSNPNANVLYFLDSRPIANALANTVLGHGHESTSSYPNCKIKFLGIGNIHVMTESFNKLLGVCKYNQDSTHWLSNLESTRWLELLSQILEGVLTMVEVVDKHGCPVVTHCSDGWDRTAQLVSLAELLLDPFYRTCLGFEILIEKEWCSFGHRFQSRCGHVSREFKEESPIFVMFIDIVWQIWMQFPCSFEFNEQFLITVLDHLYSCRFGTFLYNCEKEGRDISIQSKTVSLWSYINSNLKDYLNPFYVHNPSVIIPASDTRNLRFWTGYYLRWELRQQESVFKQGQIMNQDLQNLHNQVQQLLKQTHL